MSRQLYIAKKYKVELKPIFLNDFTEQWYFEKINSFIKFLHDNIDRTIDLDYSIPATFEICKLDIRHYLDEVIDTPYRETLETLLETSDPNNDFIYIEIF